MVCISHNLDGWIKLVKVLENMMNEWKLICGHPNGGAATVWNRNLTTEVVPVEY